MTRAFAACLIAFPACAQDTASFDGTGCQLRLVDRAGIIAEITCRNILTSGNAWSEGAMRAGDLVVGLTISHGPGDVPDVFTFAPPDGLVADPPVMVLDEKTDGVAVVREWVGM